MHKTTYILPSMTSNKKINKRKIIIKTSALKWNRIESFAYRSLTHVTISILVRPNLRKNKRTKVFSNVRKCETNRGTIRTGGKFFCFFYNHITTITLRSFYRMANISIVLDNNTYLFLFKRFINILRKYKINEIFTDSELYIILWKKLKFRSPN